jgi:hypothetical protein
MKRANGALRIILERRRIRLLDLIYQAVVAQVEADGGDVAFCGHPNLSFLHNF